MQRAHKLSLLLAPLFVVAVALTTTEARADVVVGAGVGVALPLSAKGYNAGLVVDGRLGYEFQLSPITLALEAAGGYTTLPAEALTGAPSNAKIVRIMGGAKLGFGKLIVPFAAVHAGYGWLSQSYTDPTGTHDNTDRGFALDAKIGFDIRPISLFSVGVNGGYNLLQGTQAAQIGAETIGAQGALNYLSFGVQAALAF
jgi:hypothetical protein